MELKAWGLVWAPDGDQVAYNIREGVFTLDIATRRIKRVGKFGMVPDLFTRWQKTCIRKTANYSRYLT